MTVDIDIKPTKAELAEARAKVNVYESDLDEASKKFKEMYDDEKTYSRDEAFAMAGAIAMVFIQTLELMKKYQNSMKDYMGLLEERNTNLEKLLPRGDLEEK